MRYAPQTGHQGKAQNLFGRDRNGQVHRKAGLRWQEYSYRCGWELVDKSSRGRMSAAQGRDLAGATNPTSLPMPKDSKLPRGPTQTQSSDRQASNRHSNQSQYSAS